MRHLILALWLTHSAAFGADPAQDPCSAEKARVKACNEAITACSTLVKEQDEAVTRLKVQVSTLQDKLASAPDHGLPTWAIIGTSIIVGMAAGVIISR